MCQTTGQEKKRKEKEIRSVIKSSLPFGEKKNKMKHKGEQKGNAELSVNNTYVCSFL